MEEARHFPVSGQVQQEYGRFTIPSGGAMMSGSGRLQSQG